MLAITSSAFPKFPGFQAPGGGGHLDASGSRLNAYPGLTAGATCGPPEAPCPARAAPCRSLSSVLKTNKCFAVNRCVNQDTEASHKRRFPKQAVTEARAGLMPNSLRDSGVFTLHTVFLDENDKESVALIPLNNTKPDIFFCKLKAGSEDAPTEGGFGQTDGSGESRRHCPESGKTHEGRPPASRPLPHGQGFPP